MITTKIKIRFYVHDSNHWEEEQLFSFKKEELKTMLYQRVICKKKKEEAFQYPFRIEYEIPFNQEKENRRFYRNMSSLAESHPWTHEKHKFIVEFINLHEAMEFVDTSFERIKQFAWHDATIKTL